MDETTLYVIMEDHDPLNVEELYELSAKYLGMGNVSNENHRAYDSVKHGAVLETALFTEGELLRELPRKYRIFTKIK